MQVGKLVKDLQVGDLVVRTYGEGQRPTALIVGLYGSKEYEHIGCYGNSWADIVWTGANKRERFETKFLELIQCK